MLLYAVGRQHQSSTEYYIQLEHGDKIGWTKDLEVAWCIDFEYGAEEIREILMEFGFHDTFVHPFNREIGETGEVVLTGISIPPPAPRRLAEEESTYMDPVPSTPNPSTVALVTTIVRAVLMALAGAGVISGTWANYDWTPIASAVVMVATLLWFIWSEFKKAQAAHNSVVVSSQQRQPLRIHAPSLA